ncbi:transposase [Candidatus Pacearchaeota archaeon]|nr:transposase [Candidatus Pacearchaeota archaeon]
MLSYIYKSLEEFRDVFSRQSTWLIFAMVVLGFMATPEVIGVSSFCRFWLLDVNGYHSLLRFFRSNAWSLDQLTQKWGQFAVAQDETVQSDGRAVMLGDHVYAPKDGRRMPAVTTLRQNSETQSKPSYFRGQNWGAIGLLIGSMSSPFCLPLSLRIHQGLNQVEARSATNTGKETSAKRIVKMALEFALQNQIACVLVLDAFFSVGTVFYLANSVWSLHLKAPLVTVIARAKKNYTAYFPAEEPEERKPGRPAKYGKKIKLMECFDHLWTFSKKRCFVYGKEEEVFIMALDLLWKGTGGMIRFVFAKTSRGPIVLMCSDLSQDPVKALELYCSRIRIEVMFDVLKNLIKAFHFRFWSKKMPLNSRKPKRNKDLKIPAAEDLKDVKRCFSAFEIFVLLGAIAQGLLQLVSLKYTNDVWKKSFAFIRTKSRELPSERTVKQVIVPFIVFNFFNLAKNGIMREIHERFFGGISPQTILEDQSAEKEAA